MYLKSNIGQLMSIITNLRFNRHINVTVLRCPIIYNISYGWKNVTKCPSGREADMPVDFLTTEQTESYGRFTGEPDELQLARYFHLDEADKEFIGKSRGDHNRLGIALQIGCVRFLGTFLTDMNHIPSGVRHFTARQLGIRDITVLAEYGQRENTRREHAALIRQHYQYLCNSAEFSAVAKHFGTTQVLHDINLKIDAGEYRLAADDPDEENTLATAVFTLDANHVRWQIFDINRDDAKFQGEVRG